MSKTEQGAAPITALLPGLHLLFPGNAPYARRYLTAQRSSRTLAYFWQTDSDLERVITALSKEDLPPCLDRAEVLARLSESARRTLLQKENFFIALIRRAYPPIEGEQILSEELTVLTQPWGLAPDGSVVYLRRSDFGSMAIIDGTKTISALDGELQLHFMAAPHPVFQLPDAVVQPSKGIKFDTVKSVLSILQMVLFAFGPAGVVAAGGIGVLELAFGGDNKQKLDLPKMIDDLVAEALATFQLKTDLGNILGYAKWLSDQNASALSNQMPGKSSAAYADTLAQLKGYVVHACDPGGVLLQAISNLETANYTSDPPFSVLGLPAFLLGASLHLLFEKARILLSNDATSFKSPLTTNIVNAASGYVDYINATLTVIDSAFSDRIDGVKDPEEGNFVEVVQDTSVTRRYAYITDSSAATFPTQTTQIPSTGGSSWSSGYAKDVVWYNVCWAKGCSTTGTCSLDDMKAGMDWKRDYIAKLNSQLAEKYNASEAQRMDLLKTQASFQKVVDTYKTAL